MFGLVVLGVFLLAIISAVVYGVCNGVFPLKGIASSHSGSNFSFDDDDFSSRRYNPANGNPMLGNSGIDICGNPYGMNNDL